MGAKQSNSSQSQSSSSLPPLQHAVVLNGLPGSGRSTVKAALGLQDSRTLTVPNEFLTSPPIYSAVDGYQNPNRPWSGQYSHSDKLWSYGGRGSSIPKWAVASVHTSAIIFVVDSTDRQRLSTKYKSAQEQAVSPTNDFIVSYNEKTDAERAEILGALESKMTAKEQLHQLMREMTFAQSWNAKASKPLLVLATKQDIEGALSVEEICHELSLPSLELCDWHIAGVDALKGTGMQEAVDWLNHIIAAPTDFSREIAEKDAAREDSWSVAEIKSSIRKRQEQALLKKVGEGGVPQAPPLYRTNGTTITPTAEQTQGFVLPAVTITEEDLEAGIEEEPQPTLEMISKLIGSIHEEGEEVEVDQPVAVAVASAEVESSPEREVSVSSVASEASDSSSSSPLVAEVEVSHRASTVNDSASSPITVEEVLKVVEATKGSLSSEQVSAKVMKVFSSAKFGAMSSVPFVMPSRELIPQAKMELRKKHWYSRKKVWKPVKGQERSIHEYEWYELNIPYF